MYGAMLYSFMVPRLVRSCLDSTASSWFKLNVRLVPSVLVFALGWVCLQAFGPDRIAVVAACLVPALVLHVALSFVFVGPELRSTVLAAWTGIATRSRRVS
jgi:hypothetical protein